MEIFLHIIFIIINAFATLFVLQFIFFNLFSIINKEGSYSVSYTLFNKDNVIKSVFFYIVSIILNIYFFTNELYDIFILIGLYIFFEMLIENYVYNIILKEICKIISFILIFVLAYYTRIFSDLSFLLLLAPLIKIVIFYGLHLILLVVMFVLSLTPNPFINIEKFREINFQSDEFRGITKGIYIISIVLTFIFEWTSIVNFL